MLNVDPAPWTGRGGSVIKTLSRDHDNDRASYSVAQHRQHGENSSNCKCGCADEGHKWTSVRTVVHLEPRGCKLGPHNWRTQVTEARCKGNALTKTRRWLSELETPARTGLRAAARRSPTE